MAKPSPNLSKELGILTIESMIKLENMKFGYKLINQMLPKKISEICYLDSRQQLLVKSHHYSTRNERAPNLARNMNKLYRESFLCKGPRSLVALYVEKK